MTAMTATVTSATTMPSQRSGATPFRRPARSLPPTRHLVSVPTGADAEALVERSSLRITRRGRLAITTTLAAAAVVTGLAWGGAGSAAPAGESITVREGQTLTSIARAEMPQVPVGEAVAQLQLANALPTSHVHAGQTLVIPTP